MILCARRAVPPVGTSRATVTQFPNPETDSDIIHPSYLGPSYACVLGAGISPAQHYGFLACVYFCDRHRSYETGRVHHVQGPSCFFLLATAASVRPLLLPSAVTNLVSIAIILSSRECRIMESHSVTFGVGLPFAQHQPLEIHPGCRPIICPLCLSRAPFRGLDKPQLV